VTERPEPSGRPAVEPPGSGGSLVVVGIGPGRAELITPAACASIARATDLVGYGPYLGRVPVLDPEQRRHPSDNREELARARFALELAASGRHVAVVSGGDPGIFAMAATVFEAIEAGPPEWRALDVRVEPGITAMLAAAAEAGAPLGGDFCAISLSDNLKSWVTIERRLRAAATADFVIALYNPASRARPNQLGAAFDILASVKAPETVLLFVRAAGTPEAETVVTTLGRADPAMADMRALVIVGSSRTRLVARENGPPWVYTPRREDGVSP
jgi:precorrin-3B C17-methyltransferase